MLPAHHKLHRAADFTVTMRRGRVGRTETLMVHLLVPGLNVSTTPATGPIATGRAPRFGLVISKAVGNAVVRHRTARRLRHICAQVAGEIDPGAMVVIRAFPPAATASSSDLERDLRRALGKARDKIGR